MCCSSYPVTGRTMEVAPDEHYAYVNDDALSHENVLRMKFFGLAVFKLVAFSPLQIAYRAYDLITGGFFSRGYEQAEHVHRCERRDDPHFRERFVPAGKLTYYVLDEFFVNLEQLALYPMYLVALLFSSIVGCVHPILGQRLFSRIEPLFYVAPSKPFEVAHWLEKYGNLAAPCMQTVEFRKRNNLFRYESYNYHPDTSRTLSNRLEQLMEKASSYFRPEDLQPLRDALARGNAAIRDMGVSDVREVRALQSGRTRVTRWQETVRYKFSVTLNSLEVVVLNWSHRVDNPDETISQIAEQFVLGSDNEPDNEPDNESGSEQGSENAGV